MNEANLMNLTVVSQTFPNDPEPEVFRDNYVQTISDILNGQSHTILVSGPDGVGKTTLLSQFCRHFCDNAISIFIRNTGKWFYSTNIVMLDLYNQVQWALNKENKIPLRENEVDQSILFSQYYELHKISRSNNKLFYFVLDGLDEISSEDSSIITTLIELLPLQYETNFRFVISIDSERANKILPPKYKYTPFYVPNFNILETTAIIDDYITDENDIKEIHKLCLQKPLYIASIRRLLAAGTNLEQIILGQTKNPIEFFDLEWKSVNLENEDQINLLSYLTYNKRNQCNMKEASDILDLSLNEIKSISSSLSFIDCSENDETIMFTSEAFRRFAENKLAFRKNAVFEKIINHLSTKPKSEESLSLLPAYYNEIHKFDEILQLLTPEYFIDLIKSNQSISSIEEKATLGIEVASKQKRAFELVRLSIQRSALTAISDSNSLISELQAYVSVGRYDVALRIAQSPNIKEDKLHLLAALARLRQEKNLIVDEELKTQIFQIYDQIILKPISNKKADEIASELIHSFPKLAIDIVQKSTKTETEENSFDLSMAKLAIANLSQTSNQSDQIERNNEVILNKIINPNLKTFTTAASLLFKSYSAKELIFEIEKLETTNEKLFVIRQWIRNNRERTDAITISEYGINLAITTTPFVLNATILRDLALPLPYTKNFHLLQSLISQFDAQRGFVETVGPTENYVRLQLLLARAEDILDFNVCKNRINDVFIYITYIQDLDIKTICWAFFYSSINKIDPQKLFENDDKLHSLTLDELNSSIKIILNTTADQFLATHKIIKALSKFSPDLALSVAQKLNTQVRRDKAVVELIEAYTQPPIFDIDFEVINRAIKEFTDDRYKQDSLVIVIENISKFPKSFPLIEREAVKFFRRIDEIKDISERTRMYSLSYSLLIKGNNSESLQLAEESLNKIMDSWELIDEGWDKVNSGFKVVEALASSSINRAEDCLKITEQLKENLFLHTELHEITYIGCLKLSIRAFVGLLYKKIDTEEHLLQIKKHINKVPSTMERANIWSEFAQRCFFNKRQDLCSQIVNEHLLPILLADGSLDVSSRNYVFPIISPALYFAHNNTCLELIKGLPLEIKEECYVYICKAILEKVPSTEPFDKPSEAVYKNANLRDLLDLCQLLELINVDNNIYIFISDISMILASKEYKNTFSFPQKSDIKRRLQGIIDTKLPDKNNIQHEGYKIVAEACIGQIEKITTTSWNDLLVRTRKISNIADKVFVLIVLASKFPSAISQLRKDTFEEARELINTIPILTDRIERLHFWASSISSYDEIAAKTCIKETFNLISNTDNSDINSVQRKLVDLAYRINSDFASTLATTTSDDPAVINSKKKVFNQIQTLDIKGKMVETSEKKDKFSAKERVFAAEGAWKNLAGLNSSRITTKKPEEILPWMILSSEFPINQAYSTLAWFVENSVKRFNNTDSAIKNLLPLFNAITEGVVVCEKITVRTSEKEKIVKEFSTTSKINQSILVRAGERELAINFIRNWISLNVGEYLKICDPYFGLEDLSLLRLVKEYKPSCRVMILTSKNHNKSVQPPIDEAYNNYWKINISDQVPPETEIVIAGLANSGKLPIHDRWWITNNSGLRVGTSFNSLGVGRDSDISVLTSNEIEERESQIDLYLERRTKEHNGQKVNYLLFDL